MIQEDYVSFETSKLLKESGFDVNCYTHYSSNGQNVYYNYQTPSDGINMPTLQMAMKWLREVHKLFIQVCIVPHTTVTMEQKYYFFSIHKDRRNLAFRDGFPNTYYSTYEEACEAAIKYCLEKLI